MTCVKKYLTLQRPTDNGQIKLNQILIRKKRFRHCIDSTMNTLAVVTPSGKKKSPTLQVEGNNNKMDYDRLNVHRVSKKLCKIIYAITLSNFHQL